MPQVGDIWKMINEQDTIIETLTFQLNEAKERSAKKHKEVCRLKRIVTDLQKENYRLKDELVELRNENSKLLLDGKYYQECKKKLQERIDRGYEGTVIFNSEVD